MSPLSTISSTSSSPEYHSEGEQTNSEKKNLNLFLQQLRCSEIPLTEVLSSRIAIFAKQIPSHSEEISQCIQDLRTFYRLSPRSQRTDDKFKRVEEMIIALINIDTKYAYLEEALTQLNQELISEEEVIRP